ncbi:MAG: DUF3857 domain-containing protein [Ferruginibacter sp.]
MMYSRYIFLALFAMCLCNKTSAQKDGLAYGKVDKADLEMKECSFDNAAQAMVMFDVGEVYCNIEGRLSTQLERHVRIKILTDKGFDKANIKIRYYSDHNIEDIKNISAETINLDAGGNIVYTKVDKNLIYRKKVNKRYSEVVFTFPEVKKGSIIEYKYVNEADGFSAVDNWFFQNSIPVKLSRFTMNFPVELIIAATQQGRLNAQSKISDKGNRNIRVYTMTDIPALRDEPYITCDEDYMQQVIPLLTALDFPGQPRKNLLTDWKEVIKALMEDEDFGVQLKRNIPRTKDLDSMLMKITDPYQKMVTIHNYVRKNMQWNEYFGIWALDGVRSAWKDKKGTSGEINLILVNLLKDAGLTVHPVLVSTRDNGRVNTGLAGVSQFNKVMAYVEIGNQTYVLDAINKFTPSKLIPYDVLSSEGLVIEKLTTNEWGWKVLWNQEKLFKNTTLLTADIDDKGIMKGEANITSDEYCRLERIPVLKKGKEKFIERYYSSKVPGWKIDSLTLENEDNDTMPLTQYVNFTSNTSSSGDYHYFSVNLLSGLENNPFISDNRFSDVFFGCNQSYTIIGRFTIPEGYQFDELPKNIKMIMPDTSVVFSRLMQAGNSTLDIRITLDIKKPFYSVEEYPYFQEFYKRLFELLNEQIVFKKK